MHKVLAFLTPTIIYLIIFVLNAIVPGRWVTGYVTKTGTNEKLRYRLNGIYVLFLSIAIWFLLGYYHIVAYEWLYETRWYGLAGACTFGLIFSFALVIPYPSVKKSFFADFYLGRLENPQLWGGRIDAKMWLYLIGAILLELNVLSFTYYHIKTFESNINIGIIVSAILITYFIIDYLTFEEVHLYTYDLFAERVGFKLGWGCITFYPYFYSIGIWSTADLPSPNTPTWLLAIYVIIFFSGWSLARGANMQKYFFKKNPNQSFLGIKPETISDGNKTLLVNGFWGVSRHVNYLGEILMATGIILCVGYPTHLAPWFYPIYYVVLLFPRQMDDDKRCEEKYGPLWNQYTAKVKYKIIPFIY